MSFKQLKAVLCSDPEYYIRKLFTSIPIKKRGDYVYFDAPSFNSWSYDLRKNICKDFRNGKGFDLISLYAHFYIGNSNIQALKQIKAQLGINVKGGGLYE